MRLVGSSSFVERSNQGLGDPRLPTLLRQWIVNVLSAERQLLIGSKSQYHCLQDT